MCLPQQIVWIFEYIRSFYLQSSNSFVCVLFLLFCRIVQFICMEFFLNFIFFEISTFCKILYEFCDSQGASVWPTWATMRHLSDISFSLLFFYMPSMHTSFIWNEFDCLLDCLTTDFLLWTCVYITTYSFLHKTQQQQQKMPSHNIKSICAIEFLFLLVSQ